MSGLAQRELSYLMVCSALQAMSVLSSQPPSYSQMRCQYMICDGRVLAPCTRDSRPTGKNVRTTKHCSTKVMGQRSSTRTLLNRKRQLGNGLEQSSASFFAGLPRLSNLLPSLSVDVHQSPRHTWDLVSITRCEVGEGPCVVKWNPLLSKSVTLQFTSLSLAHTNRVYPIASLPLPPAYVRVHV
ncbi:hypothetical protein F5X96DRAFT_636627 [Biscogniauxia mediterranea]|nr:hypothetical protein F5X96DRAFT_636627 [Biscogniauxia mediterranea]